MKSKALLTDLYEVTMAYGLWKQKRFDDEAVFHLFFRRRPFNGGFTLVSGLESVIDFLVHYKFEPSDLEYLATLKGNSGEPLFSDAFLKYLREMEFSCDIDAVAEGEVAFPFEPLIRVQGPLIQCQLLESALLNLTNFPTLIATKASRICLAAKGDPVLEFGLRRAQGIDGALTASRASFIGGCSSTSNLLAGKTFGIPVSGTHAHSWVMAFDSELESFQAYAEAMPDNTVFLVDTYDTLKGVENAIEVGKWLKEKGYSLLGIRLDSGDLNYLSIQARKLLDKEGFQETKIVASNELDENLISDLKQQGATIGVWGVGTHLVTGYTQPALDGVYKLSAIRKGPGKWEHKIKLSEQMVKISTPGILQIRRFIHPTFGYIGDMLYNLDGQLPENPTMLDPSDWTKKKSFSKDLKYRDLLVPIFRKGKCVYKKPSLFEIQKFAKGELNSFDRSILRFVNPHIYPVGLEKSLFDLKIQLIEKLRTR